MIRRVLMTADTVGGVWTYSLDLARALGEYGIEVALATSFGVRMHFPARAVDDFVRKVRARADADAEGVPRALEAALATITQQA